MNIKIGACTHMGYSLEKAVRLGQGSNYIAVDYSFQSQKLHLLDKGSKKIKRLTQGDGLEIRYHCPCSYSEIGHHIPKIADHSLTLLKESVDRISFLGGRYLTIHIGLAASPQEISWSTALRNLTSLVEYAQRRNIIICLENLRFGITNHPEPFSQLIKKSGAKVTFDIGHANSSPRARKEKISPVQFLKTVSSQAVNAHIYETEDDQSRHIAPENLSVIGPVLRELLEANCNWWVIELEDEQEAQRTKALLQSFLSNS